MSKIIILSESKIFEKLNTFVSLIWKIYFNNFFIKNKKFKDNFVYVNYYLEDFYIQKSPFDESKRNPSILFFNKKEYLIYKLYPSELKKLSILDFRSEKLQKEYVLKINNKNINISFNGKNFLGDVRLWEFKKKYLFHYFIYE